MATIREYENYVDIAGIILPKRQLARQIQKENEEHSIPEAKQLDRLVEAYRERRLVLVLGAGVSVNHGVPTWNKLMSRLLHLCLPGSETPTTESAASDKINSLMEHFTNLMLARYARKKLSERGSFEEIVEDQLYPSNFEERESSMIRAIHELCTNDDLGGIDSIISYNYDDLIEQKIENSKEVAGEAIELSSSCIPVYHVHGFLPHDEQRCGTQIVLSDDDYHRLYADVYHWSHLVQINKFRDYVCLFVGTSFTDPSLRRLLDIAKTQRGGDGEDTPPHSMIRKRRAKKDGMSKSQIESLKLFTEIETSDARSFGVSTIWADEYDDIPDKLSAIVSGCASKAGQPET